MNYLFCGFKHFCEEMDSSLEKQIQNNSSDPESEQPQDYFGALGDELGIEWKDLEKALSLQPWTSSHFTLGQPNKEIKYKLSAWEIVPGTLTASGADIRLKPQRGDRSYLKGNRLNKMPSDTNRYHLSREELMNFLTTGWTPAAGGAGGGMGGLPGM